MASSHEPRILLWGGKSKARIIAEMIRERQAGSVRVIFDATLDALPFTSDAVFLNDVEQLRETLASVSHYVVCVGGEYGYARVRTARYLDAVGLAPMTLVHENSFIEPTATLGIGCQVMPGALVHKFTTVGQHTIINTGATIDHECTIGNGVHVMGRVAIAGKVEIGDYATIGTNATVLPYLKIGEGAFVGAGAVVTKDVEPYAVVTGVPSRVVRRHERTFHEEALIKLVGAVVE